MTQSRVVIVVSRKPTPTASTKRTCDIPDGYIILSFPGWAHRELHGFIKRSFLHKERAQSRTLHATLSRQTYNFFYLNSGICVQ